LRRLDLYAPGLTRYGLVAERLILVQAGNDQEICWAMEEGLRNPALAAVVGELSGLSMPASRRLQLAAETSGVTGFALRRDADAVGETASAAVTRWRIAALPGPPPASLRGLGRPRWRVELLRCRAGLPAIWEVEACDATGHVSLAAELADRAAAAPRRRAGL
jgi:protein ImuA